MRSGVEEAGVDLRGATYKKNTYIYIYMCMYVYVYIDTGMYVHSSVQFVYFSMCDCALFCEVLTNLSLGAYKFPSFQRLCKVLIRLSAGIMV